MKKFMGVLLGMILTVGFTGVVSPKPAPAAGPLPSTIVYGSAPPGPMAYTIGVALSKVISDATSMKVEVLPQTWDAWAAMMETKEVDIGCGGGAGPGYLAYRGLGPYEKSTNGKGFDFNTILLGGPLKATYGAARDTNIRTLKDLKGKKVVTEYRAFLPAQITADVSLANAGLTREDLTSIPVTNLGEGLRAVTERRADASITAIGAAMCEEWHRARGMRILPIDTSREALARGEKINPAYRPYTHKAGVYPYIEEPVITYVHPWIVVARTTLPENVVYEVLKALWQNVDKLPRFHALFRQWNTADFASTASAAPYHPGAIKWYKEKGVWTSELEAYQKEMLGWK